MNEYLKDLVDEIGKAKAAQKLAHLAKHAVHADARQDYADDLANLLSYFPELVADEKISLIEAFNDARGAADDFRRTGNVALAADADRFATSVEAALAKLSESAGC